MKHGALAAKLLKLSSDFWSEFSKREFILYLVKCLAGASFCFSLYLIFPNYELSWSIVSVLLVLAPDYENSVTLATARIKANIVGALVGLGAFLLRPPDILSLCVSVVATVLVCTFFRLGKTTRTALAALVIVLLQEKEKNNWKLATQRMVSVAVGSLAALGLTLLLKGLYAKKAHPSVHPPAMGEHREHDE